MLVFSRGYMVKHFVFMKKLWNTFVFFYKSISLFFMFEY